MDDTAAAARMPSSLPAELHTVPRPPSHIRSSSERNGTLAGSLAISPTCRRASPAAPRPCPTGASLPSSASPLPARTPYLIAHGRLSGLAREFLFYNYESAAHFVHTPAKSMVSNDFFGLITTSALTAEGIRESRTASRSRRFMRFRCTAPPSARPTVNPTRVPEGAAVPVPCASCRAK